MYTTNFPSYKNSSETLIASVRRLIDKKGIQPDVEVKMNEQEEEKLQETIRQKRLQGATGLILEPSLDPQLRKAMEIIKTGRGYAHTGS